MATIANWNNSNKKGYVLDKLDWKDISQKVMNTLKSSPDLNIAFSREEAINGVKQFIQLGLTKSKDWTIETTLADLNADNLPVDSTSIHIGFRKQYSLQELMGGQFYTSFESMAKLSAYKDAIVKALSLSIGKDMFNIKCKALVSGKLPTSGGEETIVFDKEIEVDNFDETSEASIKAALLQIRQILLDYQTISLQHTKFSIDAIGNNPKALFYSAFKPSEFAVIWNSKHWNKIGNITANLFNKQDILFNGPTQRKISFNLIADAVDETKLLSSTDNIVCFIVHKDALVHITAGDIQYDKFKPKMFKTIHGALNIYGFGRLKYFPIAKIVIKSNSGGKK